MLLLDILQSFDPNIVAYCFIGFMVFSFLLAVWAISTRKHPRYQQFAPNLLTTVGILGTFVGISIGLSGFDGSCQSATGIHYRPLGKYAFAITN